ncbi:MAG: DVUA0089 family protein [Bacteroidota bacterium]
MKNLHKTIEKAAMPKWSHGTSVNSKFLYSFCAVLFLLTCSLSTKAQYGSGMSDLYVMPYTLGFGAGQSTNVLEGACTSCYPLYHSYGNPYTSGKDKWIQINIASSGYLSVMGGTSTFDSVFYLFDGSWNLIASDDDGTGSGDNVGHSALQPSITSQYVTAGTYYLIVDGSTKYTSSPGTTWTSASGTVGVYYILNP